MCGCRKSGSNAVELWKVKLPTGTVKTYSSDIAAKAKAQAVPGSTLYDPQGNVYNLEAVSV